MKLNLSSLMWINIRVLIASSAFLTSVSAHADHFTIDVQADALTEADLDILTQKLLQRPDVKSALQGLRYRVLATELVSAGDSYKESTSNIISDRLDAQIYDYTNDRLLIFSGFLVDLDNQPEPVPENPLTSRILSTTDLQPDQQADLQMEPTSEEYADAEKVIREDPRFKEGFEKGWWSIYDAMPPTIDPLTSGGGSGERMIAVGLRPLTPEAKHEIVGVNLSRGTVTRYEENAPPTAIAAPRTCGPPSAGQGVTRKGVAGSATLTVQRNGETLWSLRVLRPAASSGRKGSGVELRDVKYRGRMVLKQAHMPILNVNYEANRCGPYRDWSYAENPFRAYGRLKASGVLLASSKPSTIFDSNDDYGNFRGVAIYEEGQELVLISEISAGWYRYTSEWRLHEDGTIRPLFKFAAVYDSCTCFTHYHHAYWRLDFDLDRASPSQIEVQNSSGAWRTVSRESKFIRNSSHRRWRVSNPETGMAYEIVPNAWDGTANSYGSGDAWALAYRRGEIDDGAVRRSTAANIDAFVSGGSLSGDTVFWYAGHFSHDLSGDHGPHIVGPIIRPVSR